MNKVLGKIYEYIWFVLIGICIKVERIIKTLKIIYNEYVMVVLTLIYIFFWFLLGILKDYYKLKKRLKNEN